MFRDKLLRWSFPWAECVYSVCNQLRVSRRVGVHLAWVRTPRSQSRRADALQWKRVGEFACEERSVGRRRVLSRVGRKTDRGAVDCVAQLREERRQAYVPGARPQPRGPDELPAGCAAETALGTAGVPDMHVGVHVCMMGAVAAAA